MSLPVGTMVRLKVSCLKNSPGVLGYVFNDYSQGSQVIFENGMYDGFSNGEIPIYLRLVGESDFAYKFTNVIQLGKDFEDGVFTKSFRDRQSDEGPDGSGSETHPKIVETLTDESIRALYIDIANGLGNHGSFLVTFADAFLRADAENFQLLKPVAMELVRKYNL